MEKVRFRDIVEEIEREGLENVKFLVPMKEVKETDLMSMRVGEEVLVECVIHQPKTKNELHNELYDFFSGYKMYVKALDEKYKIDDFYVDDFIALINDGRIKWIKANH